MSCWCVVMISVVSILCIFCLLILHLVVFCFPCCFNVPYFLYPIPACIFIRFFFVFHSCLYFHTFDWFEKYLSKHASCIARHLKVYLPADKKFVYIMVSSRKHSTHKNGRWFKKKLISSIKMLKCFWAFVQEGSFAAEETLQERADSSGWATGFFNFFKFVF